jgi:Mg2+ and Co2+ transporter CorA
MAVPRAALQQHLPAIQSLLQSWSDGPLVDLHVSDLLNKQLPSHFDYTSWYDLMVFRRLTAAADPSTEAQAHAELPRIDTTPVGFAVFDRVLVTVHPEDCAVREHFAQRLPKMAQGTEVRGASRLPSSPSDLMLRMVNFIVDSYLDLRRLLSRQFAQLQQHLLAARPARHIQWPLLLEARNTLHLLEDICEDQRSAVQEWIDSLDEWPATADAQAARERELLRVRARDVLEHIERVLAHVRRLESSAETAVQMHFSAMSQRTNHIMRTLTVLTAIFLPLNLITGIFGMNFDALPLIHRATGFWIVAGLMATVAVAAGAFFWRKRYLGSHEH